jgi:uncharacterized membrane protein (Fun14 family)
VERATVCGSKSWSTLAQRVDGMRRVLIDLGAVAVLVGAGYVFNLLDIKGVLPAFGIAIIVGFGRGVAERRFFPNTPYVIGAIEWLVIMFMAYTISCYVDVLSSQYDNFETVFGFGLLLVLVPDLVSSSISYGFGLFLGGRLFMKRRQ